MSEPEVTVALDVRALMTSIAVRFVCSCGRAMELGRQEWSSEPLAFR